MRELVKSCDGCALAPHFILFDMRRKTQLKVHEHRIICPYCRTGLIFNSLMETIFVARRNCTKCSKDFLIGNSIAKRVGRAKKRSSANC